MRTISRCTWAWLRRRSALALLVATGSRARPPPFQGGDLPGVLTVVEGVVRRGRVGFVTALFFSGLDLDVQARLERDGAFDLVPLGIASRRTFRLRAQQALGLAPAGTQ